MRTVKCSLISETVAQMCTQACISLPDNITCAIRKAYETENSEASKSALGDILENIRISSESRLPLCQDTGIACVFVTLGQEVHIEGGSLTKAINEGVRCAYRDSYLRKSVVSDPIERVNTTDNTPAIIYFDIVEGDILELTVAPKGAGSENMSAVKMLTPADGIEGVKRFVIDTVRNADANPCPPVVVGVGIGGNFDRAAVNAKRALLLPIGEKRDTTELENELRESINRLNIGTMGYGGSVTCLGVNVIKAPTHIAMLPVAVNMNCHCTRHVTRRL